MDLSMIHDNYAALQQIGQGAYGIVYKARERWGEQRIVAMKTFNLSTADPEGGVPAMMIREIGLLRRLEHFEHPNILKYVHFQLLV